MDSDKPLVTVIIPVYNVQDYLDRCMKSILNQTYEKLEIIMVDDGSKDSSGIMCDKYAKEDERIKVIHQENRGLSGARNSALDIMSGEYVIFVDSDDAVADDIVETLLHNIIKHNGDIAESNFKDIYNESEKVRWHYLGVIVCNTETALEYDISGVGGVVSACGKLYRRKIFDEVRFPAGKLGEDGYSVVDIVSKADKIVIDNKPMYFYYHRGDSITTHKFSEKFFDNIEAYERNYKLIKKTYPGAIEAVVYRLDWSYLDIADRILVSEDWNKNKYLNSVMEHIKKNKKRIMNSKYIQNKRRVGVILLLFNKKLYRRLLLIDAKKKSRI